MQHQWLILFAGIGISAAAATWLTPIVEKANAQVAEPNVNTLEEQRKYQIINIDELDVTCFMFINGVDCIPDYQLNTRKKYEG